MTARHLEVDESALTGESVPVVKDVEPAPEDAPLAERASMLYAGTAVTRGRGTALVTETGEALSVINEHISSIHALVGKIEAAAAAQYEGISEVNQAVHKVELITQQNAAMVEENTAEIHGLRRRVQALNEKIDHFKTRDLETRPEPGYGRHPYAA